MRDAKAILLVDDSPEIGALFSIAAKQAGLEFEHCWNGEEALALLVNQPDRFDRVFLDVTMPVMDGVTFLRSLAAALPSFKTPIVLLTAAPPKENHPFVTDVLRKPFSLIDLNKALDPNVSRPEPLHDQA